MILYSLYWLGDFNAKIHFIFKLCDTLIVVVSQITSFWLFVRTQGFEAVIYLVIVLYYPGQAAACSLCHILETTDCSSCWSSGHRAGTQRAVGPVHCCKLWLTAHCDKQLLRWYFMISQLEWKYFDVVLPQQLCMTHYVLSSELGKQNQQARGWECLIGGSLHFNLHKNRDAKHGIIQVPCLMQFPWWGSDFILLFSWLTALLGWWWLCWVQSNITVTQHLNIRIPVTSPTHSYLVMWGRNLEARDENILGIFK